MTTNQRDDDETPPRPAEIPVLAGPITYSGGLRGQLERLLAACSSRGGTPPEPWFDLSDPEAKSEDVQSYAFELNRYAYTASRKGCFSESKASDKICSYHLTITSTQPSPRNAIAVVKQLLTTPKLVVVSSYLELFASGNPHIHAVIRYEGYLTHRLKQQWIRTNAAYIYFQKITTGTESRVTEYGAKEATKPTPKWLKDNGLPSVDILAYLTSPVPLSSSARITPVRPELLHAEPAPAGEAEPSVVSRGVPEASAALRTVVRVIPRPKVFIRKVPKN